VILFIHCVLYTLTVDNSKHLLTSQLSARYHALARAINLEPTQRYTSEAASYPSAITASHYFIIYVKRNSVIRQVKLPLIKANDNRTSITRT